MRLAVPARLVLLSCALLAGSCRTRLLVSDVSTVPSERLGTPIDGIPFRVRETHTIRVYQWHDPVHAAMPGCAARVQVRPGSFELVFSTEVPFPNLERVFAVNFQAEGFADHDFNVKYFPDNTLRSIDLKGTPNAEGLAELGRQAAAVGEKALKVDEEVTRRALALEEDRKKLAGQGVTSLSDLLDYEGKRDALLQACRAWEERKPPASENADQAKAAFLAAEGEARLKLRDLMLAAAKIGRTAFEGSPFALSLTEICRRYGVRAP